MSKQVCYGDQVYIEISNLLPPPDTSMCLLSSNSFREDSVFGLCSSNFPLANFRNCIFTIMPSFVDSNQDLTILRSLRNELSFLSQNKPNTLGEKYLLNEITYKEEHIELTKEGLEALNKKIFKEADGQGFLYGDVILLQHEQSGYYLSAELSYHQGDSSLYSLRLQKERTSSCFFKFFSYLINTDRDPVTYESEMKLASASIDTMVTMGEQQNQLNSGIFVVGNDTDYNDDYQKVKEDKEKKFFPTDNIRRNISMPGEGTVYINIGTALESDNTSRIKLIEYCTRVDFLDLTKKKTLKNGDFVRFQTDNFYLSASKSEYRETVTFVEQKNNTAHFNLLNSIFQVIEVGDGKEYPISNVIETLPKNNVHSDIDSKYYLKHFLTGCYLSTPRDKLFDVYTRRSIARGKPRIPFFQFGNVHADQQENLARNSRVTLQAFEYEDDVGEYYIESKLEDYQLLHPDFESECFVGYKNTEDKVKSKLKLAAKAVSGSTVTGTYSRVMLVNQAEMKKILEIESYANGLKNFMNVLKIAIQEHDKFSASKFEAELLKLKKFSTSLVKLTGTQDIQIPILLREFKIVDSISKLFYYFLVNTDIRVIFNKRRFQIVDLIQTLENFSFVILNGSKDNDITHACASQYVRVFIHSLLGQLPITSYCSKQDLENIQSITLSLLFRFLNSDDPETFKQLARYEDILFAKLDSQKNYQPYLLQLMDHYFAAKLPSLNNTLRENFIEKYISDKSRITKIFPQITALKTEQDFQITFDRAEFSKTLKLTQAPAEIQNYIKSAFDLITSTAKSQSLKFWGTIMDYYSEALCEDMITSPKVVSTIKNSTLAMMKATHYSYNRLPFDRLPSRIQVILHPENQKEWLITYETKIKQAESSFIGELEGSIIQQRKTASQRKLSLSINQLSMDILKDGFEKITSGDMEALSFNLQVIKNLLKDEEEISSQSLCFIHHSLSKLLQIMTAGASKKEIDDQYRTYIRDSIEIFKTISLIDDKIIRLAVKEVVVSLREEALSGASKKKQHKEGSDGLAFKVDLSEDSHQMSALVTDVSSGWKSKAKLYMNAQKSLDDALLEDNVIKMLWKIVESGEKELTEVVINLLNTKTQFEARVKAELGKCAFICNESDTRAFNQLISNFLALNEIKRRLQLQSEYCLNPQPEDKGILSEITEHLKNIFLCIYDYDLHIKDENSSVTRQDNEKSFMDRYRYAKLLGFAEVPFYYIPKCIKVIFQRVMDILSAHEILVLLLKHLISGNLFKDEKNKDLMISRRLIISILTIFMHDNTHNQNLMSTYPELIMLFYSKLLDIDVDTVSMFAEMCRNNEKVMIMNQDYIFNFVVTKIIPFYNDFWTQYTNPVAINYLRCLPVLANSYIPRSIFNPATFLEQAVHKISQIVEESKVSISIFERYHKRNEENDHQLNELVKQDLASVGLDLTFILMPGSYYLLKELLIVQKELSLTANKGQIIMIQNSMQAETLRDFLMSEKLQFNFQLKLLSLQVFENVFFKSVYKNTNIIKNIDEFTSFVFVLLMDISGYIKHHSIDEDDVFSKLYQSIASSSEYELYIRRYKEALDIDLDRIVILQAQSLTILETLWKDYVIYLVCDFFASLISNYKDFMLEPIERNHKYPCIFELWFYLILKVREINSNEDVNDRIDDALKSVTVHSEYAKWRGTVYSNLRGVDMQAKTKRVTESVSLIAPEEIKPEGLEHLSKPMLASEKKAKSRFSAVEANLVHVTSFLENNVKTVKRIISVLSSNDTPFSDVLFILKLLRKFIESKNKTPGINEIPIYMWDAISKGEVEAIQSTQNMLADLGVVRAVIDLFYRYQTNREILSELIEFSIAILFGGNNKTQDLFYKYLTLDYDNEILNNCTRNLERYLEILRLNEEKQMQNRYFLSLQHIFGFLAGHDLDKSIKEEDITDLSNISLIKRKQLVSEFNHLSCKINANRAIGQDDFNLVLMILKFLQTLCEGHYANFQEFLRDQTIVEHSKSSNVPEFLRQAYHLYYKNVNITNVEIGIKMLDLLIEIQQGGSRNNANLLLKKTFITDLCNTLGGFNTNLDLLSRGFDLNYSHPDFNQFRSKALVLLKDIVERSDIKNLQTIKQSIDLKALVYVFKTNLIAFHQKKGKYPEKKMLDIKDIWDLNLSSAYMVYFILRYLSQEDCAQNGNTFSPEISQALKDALESGKGIDSITANKYFFRFFRKFSGSIEIYHKGMDKLMRIYFPIPVLCSYLKEDVKAEFEKRVDRSSTQAKVADLIDSSTELLGQMNAEYKSRKRFLGLNFKKAYKYLRLLSNALSIALVFFDLLRLEYSHGVIYYEGDFDDEVHIILGLIQASLSIVTLFFWLHDQLSQHLAFRWDEFVSRNVKSRGALPQDLAEKIERREPLTRDDGQSVLLLKGPYSDEYEVVQSMMQAKKTVYDFKFMLQSGTFLWHIIYIGTCIGSIFHPIATAFQLFDILIRSDTVGRIFTAILRNLSQFLWTLILLLVIIYVYSLLGFYFLHSRYYQDSSDLCSDAYSCFLISLNLGLRNGGGIADALSSPDYSPTNKGDYLAQTIFDISFFILVVILMLNMIFGMIVDAFGDLRDQKRENDEDIMNVCFICGLNRGEYERTSNFDRHVTEEHDTWQYLAYIAYLREKSKAYATDLTEIEDYILDNYKKKDCSWLPCGRSLTLELFGAGGEKKEKSEAVQIKDEIMAIVNKIAEQNKQLLVEIENLQENEEASSKIVSDDVNEF